MLGCKLRVNETWVMNYYWYPSSRHDGPLNEQVRIISYKKVKLVLKCSIGN